VHLVDSSLDFWLTAGRYAEGFEAGLAEYLDIENVLLVNSGSSANLVALVALTSPKLKDRRVKPGDEVITVAAVSHHGQSDHPTSSGARVRGCRNGVYVPEYDKIEAALSPKTKAVMIAHTMGVPYPVREVREMCTNMACGLWKTTVTRWAAGTMAN